MQIKEKILSALLPSYLCQRVILDPESTALAQKLCPENFGRSLVLSKFIVAMPEVFLPNSLIRVAVVGGYRDEPEVLALRHIGYRVEVELFGIEDGMTFLDLNTPNGNTPTHAGEFDLILCSQVWEHIWNHNGALENILSLMNSGTYFWIASPASNRAHGSPFYFSAGFTAEYLANNLARVGLNIKSHGQIGTRRNYLATHTLPTWLSVSGHKLPPLYAFSEYRVLPRVFYRVRYLLNTIHLLFASEKIVADNKYVTESWVFANKI